MKLRKNQDGMAHLAVILIVTAITVIGFVGWKVWDNSKAKQDSTVISSTPKKTEKKQAPVSKIPDGFAVKEVGSTGLSLVIPDSWGNIVTNPEAKGGGYTLNGMGFTIQEDTSVKIGRSFNAPSYCSYNSTSEEWEKAGEYPPNSCEPSELTVSKVKAYGFSKGALGAYGFNYGVNLKGEKYLVIGDSILSDGTPEKDPENYPSQVDTDKLKAELDKNIKILLSNNQELFE